MKKRKKRQYGDRILQIENGSFTPLVFDTHGGMGKECVTFYKRLAEMIAEKKCVKLPLVTNDIRTKIAFSLLRSTIRCIRGSKSSHSNHNSYNLNIDISEDNSNVISMTKKRKKILSLSLSLSSVENKKNIIL